MKLQQKRKRWLSLFFSLKGPCVVGRLDEKINILKKYTELYKYKKVNNSLDISIFEGLGLRDYVKVRKYVCCSEHCQPCKKCPPLLKVGEEIIEEGYIRLNKAGAISNPGQPYNSSQAKRKHLLTNY